MKTDYVNPIFCALDVPLIEDVERLTCALRGHVGGIKLGMGFFNRYGPVGYERIASLGVPIFLDLKLHDIPQTVCAGVESLVRLSPPPVMVTLHALGGEEMLRCAVDRVRDISARLGVCPPLVLAVTVLTSLDGVSLGSLVPGESPASLAERLAHIAHRSGCDGVVCSAYEIGGIRRFWSEGYIVVPGIRPYGSVSHDQKRVSTPSAAMDAGADFLVIGRSIIGAPDAVGAVQRIVSEIAENSRTASSSEVRRHG